MAQTLDPSLVASGKSGTVLISDINAITASILSAHSGASRPTYAVEGTIWYKTSDDKYYYYDGSTDVELLIHLGSIPPTRTILTTGTAATYTTPTTAKSLQVECWGAGGGGGGCDGQGAGTIAAGTPGGAGGYCSLVITNPAASYTYTVGAAGAGGAAGANNGSAGTATTFTDGGSVNMSAGGGGGGTGHTGTSGSGQITGGTGGTSSGGDLNITGQYGGWNGALTGDLVQVSGGANTLYGVGGETRSGTGGDASGYGASGGGGVVQDLATNYAGGDGAGGLIIITEYY